MNGPLKYRDSGATLKVSLGAMLAILCGVLVWTSSTFNQARDQARKAEGEFRKAMVQAATLAQEKHVFSRLQIPPPDFASSWIRSLQSAGVPAERLLSVTPGLPQVQLERGEGGTRLLKEQASVVLAPLSLADLGRVLKAWNQQAHGCVVTRVEITEAQGAGMNQNDDATSAPLYVLLVVEGVRVESDGGALP